MGDFVTSEGYVSRSGHMKSRFHSSINKRQRQCCNILLEAVVTSDDGFMWSFSAVGL